ncbi:MAG: transglycosylase domain-containing protein [Bavariicoccus seileri]
MKFFFRSQSWHKFTSGFNIFYDVTKRLVFVLILILFFGSIFVGGIGLGYFVSVTMDTTPPTKEELSAEITNLELVSNINYDNDEPISAVRTDLVREKTSIDQISEFVITGLVDTEDSHFYEHHGVVPKAVLRALIQEATGFGGQVTGGSTLTQQLVKQQILTNEVTFERKANEILLSYYLEDFFSKDEIIESYLNVSSFGRNSNGQNIAGIEAAANGVFGVSAKDLSLPQAAFLVGLPQNPYVYTPYEQYGEVKKDQSAGIERMQTVLYRMYREGDLTHTEYEEAKNYDITKDFIGPTSVATSPQSYLYQAAERETLDILVDLKLKEDSVSRNNINENTDLSDYYYNQAAQELSTAGYKVKTTINKKIYDSMQSATQNTIGNLGPTYSDTFKDETSGEEVTEDAPLQAGSVLLENKTGKVLGFVAGRDFETSQLDHAFSTRRSPGSTIKPLLVYGPAISENLIYPANLLADTKIEYKQQDGTTWEPSNFGGTISNKFVTVRHSLEESLNNPTIKLYLEMLDKGISAEPYLKNMGINSIGSNEYANPSLAVGGTETGPTNAEQTSAFSTFGNNGKHTDYYMIESITNRNGEVIYQHESTTKDVFDEATNYIVADMLRDVITNGTASGLPSMLNFSSDNLIGKTGTSEEFRDIWFIGSTPNITLSSWIGYDNTHETRIVSQYDGYGFPSTRNLIYWSALANSLNNVDNSLLTSGSFTQPSSVYTDKVYKSTGTAGGTVSLPNNRTYRIGGQQVEDLFKQNHPPIQPTYHLLPGSTDEDLTKFWSALTKERDRQNEAKKREEERQNNNSNNNNNTNDNDNDDSNDNDDNSDENANSDNDSSEDADETSGN